MKSWKPWEYIFSEVSEKEAMVNMMNIRNDNPFPQVNETYEHIRSDRPKRKGSASIHPEDNQ